jgi:hypothetical protein
VDEEAEEYLDVLRISSDDLVVTGERQIDTLRQTDTDKETEKDTDKETERETETKRETEHERSEI